VIRGPFLGTANHSPRFDKFPLAARRGEKGHNNCMHPPDKQPRNDPSARCDSSRGGPALDGVAIDHIRAFVRLCERGLDNRGDIACWHGTSIEAMEIAVRLGGIAPSANAHAKAAPGHLFFYPPHPSDFDPQTNLELSSHGRGGAMHYARTNGQYHYLLREGGLEFSNPDHHLRVWRLVDRFESEGPSKGVRKMMGQLGFSEERIDGALTDLTARRGFLITISRSAFDTYPPSDGDAPGDDLKIFVPHGLPFAGVAGIEPLGEAEFAFFERMQAVVEAADKLG